MHIKRVISTHFKSNNAIKFKDLILFSHIWYNEIGMIFREVVEDLEWRVEVYYYEELPDNRGKIKIVFEDDTISPREILNQTEVYDFINKLIKKKDYVKESLSTRNS